MNNNTLEIVQITPSYEAILAKLFSEFKESKLEAFFHPHPFTPEHARLLANYNGQDVYMLLLHKDEAIGYGMLRGWDEGYKIPSLGIAIHPRFQGFKLSRVLMECLHCIARLRQASEIMLKVYKENTAAVRLYTSLGYELQSINDREFKGRLLLKMK